MSNYFGEAKHPETGKVEMAEWLDDYYGRHRYAVRFADGKVFRESEKKCLQKLHEFHERKRMES